MQFRQWVDRIIESTTDLTIMIARRKARLSLVLVFISPIRSSIACKYIHFELNKPNPPLLNCLDESLGLALKIILQLK
jgi:hypothetical protein